jgi:methylated-DNA-[protein]-cysteine S-methyltransferase
MSGGCSTFDSPIGPLQVISRNGRIIRLQWGRQQREAPMPETEDARDQLKAYFAGTLDQFDLPLDVEGSDTQKAVCAAMSAIPTGETRTYGDLARDLGLPAQAVGQACGGNPIPVIIPCHRVLAANSLGGFSGEGGVETKVWLLRHEKAGGLLI